MSFKIQRKSLANVHRIRADYDHIIMPRDINLEGFITHAEIMRADHLSHPVGVVILRTYMLKEKDEPQLVLSQHLSESFSPKMGFTAHLTEIGRPLDDAEKQIATNALARLARAEKERRNRQNSFPCPNG